MHTQLLSWTATAPGAAGAAAAAVVGDSLIIQNNRGNASPEILTLWGMQQASGFQQVAFPSGHDTTRGYRYGVELGDTYARLPRGMSIPVQAQEQLTVTVSGSATAGDVELGCSLIHYPDLPGVDARTLSWAQLQSRFEKMTTVFATISGTAAGYTGAELINAESDLLLANRDYALLGGSTTVDCAAVTIIGPDTGFARMAFPGADNTADLSADFFCDLARVHNRALIPVLNSGNRNSTFVGILQDENNVNVIATLYLALLKR